MEVSTKTNTTRYIRPEAEGTIKIEFGIPSEGGNSSAGVKYNFKEKAVRLAWRDTKGKFDPISTAELPYWGLMDIVESSIEKDFFTNKDIYLLVGLLKESLKRQNK